MLSTAGVADSYPTHFFLFLFFFTYTIMSSCFIEYLTARQEPEIAN